MSAPPPGTSWPPPTGFGAQAPWQHQTQFPLRRPPHPRASRDPLPTILAALIVVCLVAAGGLIALWLLHPGSVEDAGYQNESYQPPPPDLNPPDAPWPLETAEATRLIRENRLYAQSVPRPTRCEVPEFDIAKLPTQLSQRHLTALTACLMRVWNSPVAAAGYELIRPPVLVYSDKVVSKCGSARGRNAFYCTVDQRIYIATDVLTVMAPRLGANRFVIGYVLAHEFGHAIQHRTGILGGEMIWRRQAGLNRPAGLEYGRRGETQADCFAGLFLNSIAQASGLGLGDRVAIVESAAAVGDDSINNDPDAVGDHGRASSRRLWMTRGLGTVTIGICNTFIAPADEVE